MTMIQPQILDSHVYHKNKIRRIQLEDFVELGFDPINKILIEFYAYVFFLFCPLKFVSASSKKRKWFHVDIVLG